MNLFPPYNPHLNHRNPADSGENRLLFFAGGSGKGKGPPPPIRPLSEDPDKKSGTQEDRFSPEYQNYLSEMDRMADETHAKKIAKLARDGRIEPEVLKQVREVLRNPNKMAKDQYKYFMKALGQGRFPNKSKFAIRFLQALDGTDNEKAYAKKFLRGLSEESSMTLSERREKDALQKLSELRESDLAEQARKETSTSAAAVTETAGISAMIENVTMTGKRPANWTIEKAPEELVETLDRLETAQAQIATESNRVHDEYRAAQSAKNPDKDLLGRLKRDLIRLDDEFDKLQRELSRPRKEFQDFMTRTLARYRALEDFFKKAGVDVRTAERLRMWFLDLSSGREVDKKKTSLKLLGIQTDPGTGIARKQETTIEITGLRFEKDKEGLEPGSPGELVIEYVNEKGESKTESYKNFLQIINAFEAYEEIDSLDELNKRAQEQLGYTDLATGQEFETEVLVGFDKENKEIREKHGFTVQSIDSRKGTVTLNHSVKKIPRQWIQNAVHPSLYFDRRQQVFPFGEFAKLLKQHNFERKVGIDETEELRSKASAALREECAEFGKNSPERIRKRGQNIIGNNPPKLSLPSSGGEKEVLFLDNSRLLRWGKLKRGKIGQTGEFTDETDDQETYSLEEIPNRFREMEDGVEKMLSLGIPSIFAYADRAKTRWKKPDEEQKQKLSPLELARLVREGSITDAPAVSRPTEGARLELIEHPERIAAFKIQNKEDFGHAADGAGVGHDMQAGQPGDGSHAEGQGSHAGPDAERGDHADHAHGEHESHDEHAEHGKHGHDAKVGHEGEHEHAKQKYYEEALPIDQVKKSGGMTYKEQGLLKTVWNNTRFFSMNDFWQMGKAMWEYYDKRFERRQKDKYARVGEELPYFSPEMRRIVEATEHEHVHHFQEAFEHKGIYEIQSRLEKTGNKDELKATFITLSDKGQLRWDSIELWKNINKFVKPELAIPIPSNGDPNTRISAHDNRTGFDYLKGALDSIWGEGTYDGWFSKNKSAYSSNSKGFYEEGKQLEGVEGGHELRLSVLLQQHKNGIYVNPHEYEGLILHSIEAGKSNMQAKIYYMIEGVAAANHSGRTIMPFDRIAHINSEMLNSFPILEYICARVPRGPDGEEKYRWTIDDYKQWVHWFDDGHVADPSKNKPTQSVDDFMWKYIIPSDETQNRINKALRNGEKLDHDDMFAYLPPATFEVVNDACKATTGSKKFLTIEGYANVFPGFSQYMRSVAKSGRRTKLREAIKSYVRFEGIMTNRYQKTSSSNDPYQRMSPQTLGSRTICSVTPPQAYINQTRDSLKEIAMAYDDPDLTRIMETINQPEVDDIYNEAGQKQQKVMNLAFEQFNKVFDRVVKTDNGAKMEAIINHSNFFGMAFSSSAEQARAKAEFADKMALE